MTYDGECVLQDYEGIGEEGFDGRPDWCPLITETDLLKQVASPFSKWEYTVEQDELTEHINIKKAKSEE
jgi:hypothetical protein